MPRKLLEEVVAELAATDSYVCDVLVEQLQAVLDPPPRSETYVCEGCGQTFPQNQSYKVKTTCSGRCRAQVFRNRAKEKRK